MCQVWAMNPYGAAGWNRQSVRRSVCWRDLVVDLGAALLNLYVVGDLAIARPNDALGKLFRRVMRMI